MFVDQDKIFHRILCHIEQDRQLEIEIFFLHFVSNGFDFLHFNEQ